MRACRCHLCIIRDQHDWPAPLSTHPYSSLIKYTLKIAMCETDYGVILGSTVLAFMVLLQCLPAKLWWDLVNRNLCKVNRDKDLNHSLICCSVQWARLWNAAWRCAFNRSLKFTTMLNANVVTEELQRFMTWGMDIDWFYWDREAASDVFGDTEKYLDREMSWL